MNLRDLFLRLLDEQKWREQKAQQMSSGLGSMPYNFDETMNLKYPTLMDVFRKKDEEAQQDEKIWDNIAKEGPVPSYAPHRYYLKEGYDLNWKRNREREKKPL